MWRADLRHELSEIIQRFQRERVNKLSDEDVAELAMRLADFIEENEDEWVSSGWC